MNMKKLQSEVLWLSDQCYEFAIEAESSVGRFDVEQMDPYALGVDLESWYAAAVQVMASVGFHGIGRFERLYEDEHFSMLRYICCIGSNCRNAAEHGAFVQRLWMMLFILNSLPVAYRSASSGDVYGMDSREMVSYLQDAIEQVTKGNLREAAPGARSHLEEAVNMVMARHGLTASRRSGHKRAIFQDKLDTLQQAGLINGTEREKLDYAFRMFIRTAHPEPLEPIAKLKFILEDALVVIRRLLPTVNNV
jgi:hypothetical protein